VAGSHSFWKAIRRVVPLSPRRSLSTERVFRERVGVGNDGVTIVGKGECEKEAIAEIDDGASFQFYGV